MVSLAIELSSTDCGGEGRGSAESEYRAAGLTSRYFPYGKGGLKEDTLQSKVSSLRSRGHKEYTLR